MWQLAVCAYLSTNLVTIPCQFYTFNTEKECNEARKTLPQFPHGYAVCALKEEKK